jgi:hypothetical protein
MCLCLQDLESNLGKSIAGELKELEAGHRARVEEMERRLPRQSLMLRGRRGGRQRGKKRKSIPERLERRLRGSMDWRGS